MAESVVVPLLTDVVKPVVQAVASRVVQEIHCFRKFERELNDLLEKIQMIASTVESMTVIADKAVEQWLRKALRIIQDAENLMDLLAYDKHRSVVIRRRPKKIARLVFSPLERVHFRRKMGRWIRRIDSNIEAALKDAHTIHELKAFVQSAASLQPVAAATSIITDDQQLLQQVRRNVDTSLFVGRDSDVAIVVDMLLRNHFQNSADQIRISSCRLSVVAIVGIGGLGKTTLAKKVCDNERVITYFSQIIWISELKDFNIEKTLNKMVEFLGKGKYEDASSETAIKILEEHLGGKRYLLVLDDFWNTNLQCWDSLRHTLERIGGSKDSMVLTTTRGQ